MAKKAKVTKKAAGSASGVKQAAKAAIEEGVIDVSDAPQNAVHVKIGKVINLGNYESLRVEVGVSQLVDPAVGNAGTHRACVEAVTERLTELLDMAKETFGA